MDKQNSNPPSISTSKQFPTIPRPSLAQDSLNFPTTGDDDDQDDEERSDSVSSYRLKPKRLPLIYPSSALGAKSNQKPFSRSAAKRDSVMALGSIGYLQHFYAKQGIASKNRPVMKGHLTLAIGHAGESMLSKGVGSPPLPESPTDALSSLEGKRDKVMLVASPDREQVELPPSPKAPTCSRPPYPNVPKPVEADPEALWPVLLQDLDVTCQLWGLLDLVKANQSQGSLRRLSTGSNLDRSSSRASSVSIDEPNISSDVDLLLLMNSTIKTIRSVRNYLLALPPDSLKGQMVQRALQEPRPKDQFRRQSSFSSIPRPSLIENKYGSLSRQGSGQEARSPVRKDMPSAWYGEGVVSPTSSQGLLVESEAGDPLTLVRKSALDVLGALRELEEKYRLPLDHPDYANEDESSTGQSLGLTDDRVGQPAKLRKTLTQLSNPSAIDLGLSASQDRAEEGYLYRSDLLLSDIDKERKEVKGYLTIVDKVLSVVKRPKISRVAGKRLSAAGDVALATESTSSDANPTILVQGADASQSAVVDDDLMADTLPDWVTRTDYPGGEIARIRAFLLAHLSPELGLELIQASTSSSMDIDHDMLLSRLTDGQMLCLAYNTALRQSGRPWGFIQAKEIHDLKEQEAKAQEKKKELARQGEEGAEPFQVKGRREASQTESAEEPMVNKPGWTFRRAENLSVWAAALKLRYHIQTTFKSECLLPSGKASMHPRRVFSEASTSSVRAKTTTDAVGFDAKIVARKEEGWQDMLCQMLERWVKAVADEERG